MPEIQKNSFTKPSLSVEEQADLLASRGLSIPDRNRLLHYLKYIGYYRLSGYCLYYKTYGSDQFKAGTTFQDVLGLYKFDRELRLLVMDAVERIEVAVRSCICNTMSGHYGPHWFMDKKHFQENTYFRHSQLIEKIKENTCHPDCKTRSKSRRELFTEHYYNKYNEPGLPPCWMVAEVMPLGSWSQIFSHLADTSMQREISDMFCIHYKVMESWLHVINYLRNLCAHHSRLWNRSFSIRPKKVKKYNLHFKGPTSFYAQAVVLKIFMSVIADGSTWHERMAELFEHYRIPINKMGFPDDWRNDPLWRSKR